MRVIGLTGGICAGKSTAATVFLEFGVDIIDADKFGHKAYEPGTHCFDEIVAKFGSDILSFDGSIDRKSLGGKVFNNKVEMKKLTDIVWPEIRRSIKARIEELKILDRKLVVVEAAVMIEAGWQDLVDELWVFVVRPDVSISRLMKRNGLSEIEASVRVSSQLSNEDRTPFATKVFSNDENDPEMLRFKELVRNEAIALL